MKIKHQRGFALILELVLVGLLLAVAAGAGYYHYHAASSRTAQNASTKQSPSGSISGTVSEAPAGGQTSQTTITATALPSSATPANSNNPSNSSTQVSPPAAAGTGTVAGHVYQNCGNSPLSGCQSQGGSVVDTISLVDANGKTVASQSTDGTGYYSLSALAGSYTVKESARGFSAQVTITAGQTNIVNF